METNVVELRYKMKKVLQALDRREKVKLLYHGKMKGTIYPVSQATSQKITSHPFFGMFKADTRSVSDVMDDLRGSRHRAV